MRIVVTVANAYQLVGHRSKGCQIRMSSRAFVPFYDLCCVALQATSYGLFEEDGTRVLSMSLDIG